MNVAARLRAITVSAIRIGVCLAVMGLADARPALAFGGQRPAVEPGSPAETQGLHGGEFELVITGQPLLLGGDIITVANGIQLDDRRSSARCWERSLIRNRLSVADTRCVSPNRCGLSKP